MKDFQDACEESTFSKVDDDPFFIFIFGSHAVVSLLKLLPVSIWLNIQMILSFSFSTSQFEVTFHDLTGNRNKSSATRNECTKVGETIIDRYGQTPDYFPSPSL